jgi:hypothetical protein
LMVFNTVNAAALGLPRNWHGQLVKALATRDPDIAERAMREHVQFNVAQQMKMLESNRLSASADSNGSAASKKRAKKSSRLPISSVNA